MEPGDKPIAATACIGKEELEMFCITCGTPNLETEQHCRNCSGPLVSPSGFDALQPPERRQHPAWPYLLAGALVLLALPFAAALGHRMAIEASLAFTAWSLRLVATDLMLAISACAAARLLAFCFSAPLAASRSAQLFAGAVVVAGAVLVLANAG